MPWSPLGLALAGRWAQEDRVPLLLLASLHTSWLLLSRRLLSPRDVAAAAGLAAAEAAAAALNLAAPAVYRRWRLLFVAVIRLLITTFPLAVDITRTAMHRGGGGSGGSLLPSLGAADAASALRALARLLLPVSWLHALLLGPLALHLPPTAHLLTHTAATVLLMRRAGTACQQYVAEDPANARLAAGVYWLGQQVVSLVCPGTRASLAAAGAAAPASRKCTAAVWALQASLGFVLPTLLSWRAQLAAVRAQESAEERAWLAAQRQRGGGSDGGDPSTGPTATPGSPRSQGRRRVGWGPPPEVDRSLMRSEYRLLCEPVMAAAAGVGWAVVVLGAGLAAWVAAVVRSSHVDP